MSIDSSDSRSVVAVLVICALLLVTCIAIPTGVGAILFVRFQQATQAELAAQRDALAAEQQAMAQAEAARQAAMEQMRLQAEQMRLQAEQMTKSLQTPPADPPSTHSLGDLPLDSRKVIYQQLKLVDSQLAALEALAADDPALQDALNVAKSQKSAALDQLASTFKIDREQLDAIIAQGDKEMW
jgi:hypothetical protein